MLLSTNKKEMKFSGVTFSMIWILLLINIKDAFPENICENHCKCTVDVDGDLRSLICTNTTMNIIENYINSLRRKMYYCSYFEISHAQMTEISSDTFSNSRIYNNGWLAKLILNNNDITSIMENAFNGLTNYEVIDLSHNQIATIKYFAPLQHLQYLNVSYNKLESISNTMLNNLPNLIELNVEHNNLKIVTSAAFKPLTNLHHLKLNNNQLDTVTINMFNGCFNLQYLYLQENRIKTITPTAFVDLNKLILLNITRNTIGCLETNAFMGLSNLPQLNLTYLNITAIEPGAFSSMTELLTLDMRNNKLERWSENFFKQLSSLQWFFLEFNDNDRLPEFAFYGLKNVEVLNMHGISASGSGSQDINCKLERNIITTTVSDQIDLQLKNNTFMGLNNLRQLNLSDLRLTSIHSGTFRSLSSLRMLDLSSTNLKSWPGKAFSDLHSLGTFYLAGNHIEELPEFAFYGLKNLKELRIYGISAKKLSDDRMNYELQRNVNTVIMNDTIALKMKNNTFTGLNNLQLLNLSDLRLLNIHSGTFTSLNNLDTLDLSSTNLKIWPGKAFSDLHALRTFCLACNQIEELPEFAFYGMKSIQLLNIEHEIDASKSVGQRNSCKFERKRNTVTMKDSNIFELKNNTFVSLSNLNTLNFINLTIKKVNSGAFRGLFNLRYLHLCNTTLQNLDSYAFLGFGYNTYITSACSVQVQTHDDQRWFILENLSIKFVQSDAFNSLNYGLTNENYYNFLYLNGNQLSTLPTNTFKKVFNVIILRLDQNTIDEIEPYAFNGLSFHTEGYYNSKKLKCPHTCYNILYLNNNKLKILKRKSFSNINNLVELRFDNNKIKSIESGAFDGLSFHVKVRTENYNNYDSFYGYNSIYLNNSKLTNLLNGTFVNVKHLALLKLDHNAIENIEAGAFHGLLMLEMIDSVIHEYNSIYLNHNNLTILLKHTFVGIENLKILRLNNNNIGQIQLDAFVGLDTLKTLKLNYNNLENIIINMFRNLPQLENLHLNNNKISALNPESFAGLINLQNLYLDNNKIKELPLGSFKNFPLLENLHLGKNFLTRFGTGSFSNLGNLKLLNFSHNSFSTLNETVLYPLRELDILDLDNNNFSYINYTSLLLHLPNLKFISVNNNNWDCDLLTHMLKTFRTAAVDYLFNKTSRYTEENVDGILCFERVDQPKRTTLNNITATDSEKYKIYNAQINEMVLKFMTNILNNSSPMVNEDAGKPVVQIEKSNKENTSNVLLSLILVSLICISILLSIIVYKKYFKNIANRKHIQGTRSEIELLNAGI